MHNYFFLLLDISTIEIKVLFCYAVNGTCAFAHTRFFFIKFPVFGDI